MEDFVPFELAVKLNEKGFRKKCLAYYDVEDNVGLLYNTQYTNEAIPCQYTDLLQCHNTGEAESQIDDSDFCIDAPTISQVLDWLRKEKKLHIIISASYDESYWWEVRDFNRKISFFSDEDFDTYEKATIAAIEDTLDTLDNLI